MKSTNCGIYKITNLIIDEVTGINKIYTGSSKNLKSRKYSHFKNLKNNKHINNHLQNAVKKYGIENFKWEIIKYIDKIEDKKLLKKILLEYENLELNKYKNEDGSIDHNKCYNIRPFAESNLGIKHSEEYKDNCRKRMLGNKFNSGKKYTQEHKNKISKGNIGKSISEQHKKIISEFHKGNKWSLGIKHTKEFKENLKNLKKGNKNNLGKKFTEDWKNNISRSKKGKPLTEEHKQKLKESSMGKGSIKIINLTTNKICDSIIEASNYYSINKSSISQVCKGNRKTAGKYKWMYYNEFLNREES